MFNMGSPPPMRGKVTGIKISDYNAGITPAYAGKSNCRHILQCVHKDHPRLCGEKLTELDYASYKKGSPPPMRGKETYPFITCCYCRITPAYAGKR